MNKHEEAIKELSLVFALRERQVGEYRRDNRRAEADMAETRVKNMRETLIQLMEEEKADTGNLRSEISNIK